MIEDEKQRDTETEKLMRALKREIEHPTSTFEKLKGPLAGVFVVWLILGGISVLGEGLIRAVGPVIAIAITIGIVLYLSRK